MRRMPVLALLQAGHGDADSDVSGIGAHDSRYDASGFARCAVLVERQLTSRSLHHRDAGHFVGTSSRRYGEVREARG